MRIQQLTLINTLVCILTTFLSVTVKFDPPLWTGYGDPYDYLHQSREEFTSGKLYFPEKDSPHATRPFTTPLPPAGT